MHDLVSRLTAGGITCVNVDRVFLKLKSLGMQKSLHKWCNHGTAISTLGDHLRGRIVAIGSVFFLPHAHVTARCGDRDGNIRRLNR